MRTDRLQREFGIEVRWSVFPLHPETPEEGVELSELFAGRDLDIRAMQERLLQVAAREGLPFSTRTRTYNSRRAQELGKWAEARGRGNSFHQAVYRAYFVEGRNIALIDQLLQLVEASDLPVQEAQDVLISRSYAAAVDADWQRSRQLRISAVPTHLCDGRKLAGFSSYEGFVRLIGQG